MSSIVVIVVCRMMYDEKYTVNFGGLFRPTLKNN